MRYRSKSTGIRKKRGKPYIWFMLPGMSFYIVFMIIPLIVTIIWSFTSWDGTGPMTFVGLRNFMDLFFDEQRAGTYWNAFGNNLKFILAEYVIILPIQLLMAYLFFIGIRWSRFFQAMIFLPYVLSTAVIAFFATVMFNANFGVINKILMSLGVSRTELPAWLADPDMMFPILIIISIWYSSSIGMLIILADMKGIAGEILDAARVDGASHFQQFLHIVLPGIGPSMTNVITLDIVWGITEFDLPYMLVGTYGGAGGNLDFVNMYFYRTAFGSGISGRSIIDYGYAASIGTLSFLIILVFTMIAGSVLGKVKAWNE